MIVKVTQRHIDTARAELKQSNTCRCIHCPIGQALNKKYWVGPESIMEINTDIIRCNLPKAAIIFIEKFDMDRPVKPFQFTINLD